MGKKNDSQKRDVINQGIVLSQELRSESGLVFVNLIEETLMTRIEELVRNDPFCKGLVAICDRMNLTLGYAQRATEELMGKAREHIK